MPNFSAKTNSKGMILLKNVTVEGNFVLERHRRD